MKGKYDLGLTISYKVNMKTDANIIAHTTWNCKYHIVFAPKYRRKVIYGKIKVDIG